MASFRLGKKFFMGPSDVSGAPGSCRNQMNLECIVSQVGAVQTLAKLNHWHLTSGTQVSLFFVRWRGEGRGGAAITPWRLPVNGEERVRANTYAAGAGWGVLMCDSVQAVKFVQEVFKFILKNSATVNAQFSVVR